ncbi:COX17-domain-containing protein [Coniophora puteana RWD-64-598 SS2]|uniref:COX17-domain-containing protein n=1 Tax=Coniophora puteana (strain RWD-64-598) TaxID=741705 RepID=A0A5M3N3U3_CONPW|nr:COX17-domain-containing protein [Coniophora puteana RWD-64-598 SS2]EIW85571.1 COX17-domain-containing protein [Coniophora puteana RWD-64-598 SS2]
MFESVTSWIWPKKEEKYDPTNPKMNPLNPQGLKPCCACPDTKAARDKCFLESGGNEGQCADLVRAHVECMRGLGFKV